jgi:peptidylprolyl isomerase
VRRLIVATIAATSLVLAGCGSDDSARGLGDITVSKAAKPKVTVEKGFTATKTTSRVLSKGSGLELAAGDSVKVNYVAINGRTGKEFDNSFTSDKPLTLTLSETAILPGFVKGLTGQKVGSRLLVAIPPKDGFGKAQPDLGMKKNDTMVFLFDVVAKVPAAAAGKPKPLPKDLPKLVLDAKSQPSKFEKTSATAATAKKASAHVVIEGSGPAITLGQTLSVHYLGQIYPSGKVFDSSWARNAPSSFTLAEGQLIKCWTDLLVGQKVGSRVVLVCPADVAYGKEGSGEDIKAGDTLIFSIDLLDAS